MFSDFEQVIKLVLLTLGRLSCFSDGCFSDVCFLDNCFLDDCFLDGCLLTLRQKLVIYFVEFVQIKKISVTIKNLFAHAVHDNLQDFFIWSFVKIYSYLWASTSTCVSCLHAFVWILKHQKYWYFFLLKKMGAKLWVLANILAKNF